MSNWTDWLPDGHALRGCRILIVESEVFTLLDLTFTCEVVGAEVAGAVSVRAAMDLLAEAELHAEHFDAAVLDLSAPDGSTMPIRDALERHHVPYLIYSSGTGVPNASGATDIVCKPQLPELVAAALARAIHQRTPEHHALN